MSKGDTIKNLKFRYFFFIAMALSAVILISVNQKIEERQKQHYQAEQFQKFDDIIRKRNLRDISNETESICLKGDKNLYEYYNTSDISKIELGKEDFGVIEKQPEHIQNLINIIGGGDVDLVGFAKSYINRLIPVAVFLLAMILSIPGAIICCCCCCCKCCCCCCKKPSCKCPCLIITFLFSAVAIACTIYGLGVSGSVFTGLASTECSILQFTNVISEGEKKEELPKWAGINGILNLMDNIQNTMENEIKHEPKEKFNEQKQKRQWAEGNFTEAIEAESINFIDSVSPITVGVTPNNYVVGRVFRFFPHPVLDPPLEVRRTKSSQEICNNSQGPYVYCLKYEFDALMNETNKYLDEAEKNFDVASNVDFGETIGPIKETINGFTDGIENIKDMVADLIINYGDLIDQYGRLGFTALFGVLAIIEAALVAFTILLFLCSSCTCCKCFACLTRCCINIFWIVLSILMIFVFLFAFLFTFIGTIGEDLFTVINCLVGPDNMRAEEPIPNFIADVSKFLEPCLFNDSTGDLSGALDLGLDSNDSAFGALDEINNLTNQIDDAEKNLSNLTFFSYDNFINDQLKAIEAGKEEYMLVQPFYNKINVNDKKNLTQIDSGELTAFKTGAGNQARDLRLHLEAGPIKAKYEAVIKQDKETLETYKGVILNISAIFKDVVGDGGGAFDLLNCKFMGINVRIMIKYLGDVLGKSFKTTGIVLGVCGFGMVFVISSVILAKESFTAAQKQKEEEEKGEIPEMQEDYDRGNSKPTSYRRGSKKY